jgi:hypothetical protein
MALLIAGFALATPASAEKTNSTRVGWVSSNHSRSTASLLWSCIVALLACLWTVQHPNVRPQWKMKDRVREQAKWILFSAMAPEVVAYMAMIEYFDAKRYTREKNYREGWTLTHSFYALMGGFVAESEGQAPTQLSRYSLDELVGNHTVAVPEMPERVIDDMAKVDPFSKVFTCLQSACVVIEVIARAAKGLPVSELELATIAYIICLFTTYAFWWKKPQGVCTTTRVTCLNERRLKENLWGRTSASFHKSIKDEISSAFEASGIGLAVFSVVFGSIHVIAWNFSFPSSVERIMWISCSLTITALPPLILISVRIEIIVRELYHSLGNLLSDGSRQLSLFEGVGLLDWIAVYLYAACRVFLIIEMFISLRSQPAALYQTVRWADYIPHI